MGKILRLSKSILKLLSHPEKLRWKMPTQAEILVYDQVGSRDLEKILLRGLTFEIFSTRGEFFYLHPLILIATIYHFLGKKISLRQAYDVACLRAAHPRVLLTYIDNGPNFGTVAKFVDAKIFVIQNGFRTSSCVSRIRELPSLFCFGQRDKDLYASRNISVQNFEAIGSIKASYFIEEVAPQLKSGGKYDICLISSFQPGMECEDFVEPDESRKGLVEGTYRACEYLSRLAKEKNLRIAIAGWQPPGEKDREIAFFKKYFGENMVLKSAHSEHLSSYRLAYESQLVLSYCSTLGFEAMSWGQKVFFFHMPREKNYRLEKPHSALFQIQEASYEEFSSKIEGLLQMSLSDYRHEIKEDANYVMASTGRPAHHLLRSLMEQAFQGP